MKNKILLLVGATLLLGTSGCIVRERDYRGGYYDRQEYSRGVYHSPPRYNQHPRYYPNHRAYPYHRD